MIPGVALLNMAGEETKVVGPNTSAVLYGIGDLKLVSYLSEEFIFFAPNCTISFSLLFVTPGRKAHP